MFRELRLLIQVVDFIVKACQAYAGTPEGQKELQDIADEEAAMSAENPSDTGSGSGSFEGAIISTLDAARSALKSSKKA